MSASAETESYQAVLAQLQRTPNDQEAWGRLFRLTWPFVLGSCHRSLPAQRRALEAEDLAQEVYLKFARYWHQSRPPVADRDSLFSLLAVMTRHLAVDAGRWRSRARRDVTREQPGPDKEIMDREDEFAEMELRDLLDKVCLKLDAQERQIVGLRLQGYHLSEIAEQLKVSERTIERRFPRIRRVVRSQLELDDLGPRTSG